MPTEVDDMNRLRLQAERRFAKLEAACREEHGGKYYEAECPICVALDGPNSTRFARDAKVTKGD